MLFLPQSLDSQLFLLLAASELLTFVLSAQLLVLEMWVFLVVGFSGVLCVVGCWVEGFSIVGFIVVTLVVGIED